MSLYSLDLPNDLLEEIQQFADSHQLSLEQWLMSAIAQKIETEKTQRVFQQLAQKADFDRFDQIMARVPESEPVLGDERDIS